jgi:hypothetical protein
MSDQPTSRQVLYLTVIQKRALRDISKETGACLSEVARRLLERALRLLEA